MPRVRRSNLALSWSHPSSRRLAGSAGAKIHTARGGADGHHAQAAVYGVSPKDKLDSDLGNGHLAVDRTATGIG